MVIVLPSLRETPGSSPSLVINPQFSALAVSGDLAPPWTRVLLQQTQLPGSELSPDQRSAQFCGEKFMSLAALGRPEQQVLHIGAGQAQGDGISQVPPFHLCTEHLFLYAGTHRGG